MSEARDIILGRICASLSENGKAGGDEARHEEVEKRLRGHPQGVVPHPADAKQAVVDRFIDKAQAAGATVEKAKQGDVAKAVSAFLRDHNLPQQLRVGADERLEQITWQSRGAPELLSGPSDGNDLSGLSHAFAGAGETGTLVLTSGPDNPTTINFLPENHIVVVDAQDIEFDYEAIWTRLRHKAGAGKMPRTVNLITGPSRSADIEQTLIMGAHGPVRLHIIVVTG
ncbi:MAG: lactate utilization protein [Salaquimonas sp.]|nr:lactate utilization protein [Salaquimonas sp.]